jgi:hypothetical protein
MTSVIPAAFTASKQNCKIGFPPTLIKCLGRVAVTGKSLTPSPAASKTAFILFYPQFVSLLLLLLFELCYLPLLTIPLRYSL